MASSAPSGGGTPPNPTPPSPGPAPSESHKLRDGIILAVVGALATGVFGLVLTLVTNATLVSGNGGVVLGSSDNLPTNTVTSEVEGPVVTQTVTKPPTTVTVTAEPAVDAPRRTGDVVLVHDFFGGGSIDMDTMDANWRYGDDAYRQGIDLVANCCDLGLSIKGGALELDTAATDPAAPELREQCASATGVTDGVSAPRVGTLYCATSDEGRTAVFKVTDDGLDSSRTGIQLVVW